MRSFTNRKNLHGILHVKGNKKKPNYSSSWWSKKDKGWEVFYYIKATVKTANFIWELSYMCCYLWPLWIVHFITGILNPLKEFSLYSKRCFIRKGDAHNVCMNDWTQRLFWTMHIFIELIEAWRIFPLYSKFEHYLFANYLIYLL